MEEKPGVTPILETMMRRSLAGTTSRTICSTCSTSLSVSSMRVPVGRLEIDDELAGVGAREVGFADQRVESQAEDE